MPEQLYTPTEPQKDRELEKEKQVKPMELAPIQEQVFRQMMSTAEKAARAKSDPMLEFDDIYSIALESLHKAIYTYDPSQGTKLITLFGNIFNNDFITYVKHVKQEFSPQHRKRKPGEGAPGFVSLDQPISKEDDSTTVSEVIEDLKTIKVDDLEVYKGLVNHIKKVLIKNEPAYWATVFDTYLKQQFEGTYVNKDGLPSNTVMFQELGKQLGKSPAGLRTRWHSEFLPMIREIVEEQYA